MIHITKLSIFFYILWIGNLFSAGAIYDPSKVALKESPFKACKGIKFLSEKDYEKRTEYWDQRCRGGAERIQILPESGGMFLKLQNATSGLALLSAVGAKVIKKMNANIEVQETILNCFNGKKKGSYCDKLTNTEIEKIYQLFGEMRKELALSEGEDIKMVGSQRGSIGKIQYPEINESINSTLKKSFLGMVGVYRPDGLGPLTTDEKTQALSLMQSKIDEIKTSAKIKTDKERVAVFQQVRAAHKARYLEIFQEAPMLTMIGKLPKKENRKEIHQVFTKALEELLKLAKQERGQILSKWSRASMTPEIKDSRAFRAKGDENRSNELLSFMSYQPIVDEVLSQQMKENPLACSIAEELSSAMESENFKKEIVMTGAVVGGAIALTALSGGSAALILPEMVPIVGGMALSAQTAVAIALGPGIGFYTRKISANEMDASKAAVATGLKKAEDLDRIDGNILIGNATIGLDYLGIGLFKTAGESIFKVVAKKALMTEGLNASEAEKLILLSQSTATSAAKETQLAQERIKNSIRLKVKSFFPSREPSKEELEAFGVLDELAGKQSESIKDFFERMEKIADKNEKKEALTEAIKLIKLQNKKVFENASPQTLRELNKQVVAIARYGDIKDPAKIAAILSGWEDGAKGKLSQVFEEARTLLNDTNFMKGKTLKEKREYAFRAILEKKKVSDPNKRQEMCMCSGVCTGGSVALNVEIDKIEINQLSICAKNDLITWYIE